MAKNEIKTDPKDEPQVEPSPVQQQPIDKKNKIARLWQTYLAKKKLTIPLTVLFLLILIMLIPFSRYKVLGLFIKRQFSIVVTDTTTNQPVTNAVINLSGKSANTNNQGKASINSKIGNATLTVTKKYYKDYSQKVLVPLSKSHDPFAVKLQATGRQVPVTIFNGITGQAVENVSVKASDTEAKTDKDGTVTIVLPPDKDSVAAELSGSGYNTVKVTIKVTEQKDPKNSFTITPEGKIYFLSKASGKIDVVKTNLDGTDRETVLAGTGKEEDTGTVLLASRDWKYLALKSRRDGNIAKLYLIETANDKLTNIDSNNADFTITGWINSSFVYTANRIGVDSWQPKAASIKIYNASSKILNTIDETQATGDQNNYASESIAWINTVGSNELVYFKSWSAYHTYFSYNFDELSGKQAQLISVTIGSTNAKKTIKAYDLSTNVAQGTTFYTPINSNNSALYEPNEVYFSIDTFAGAVSYNKLQSDNIEQNNNDAKQSLVDNKAYPTFLLSPNAHNTFWSESRDGKNSLFVGDANGASGNQIASLSEFTPFGWYTDNYLLVSKNGSELYILGNSPIKDKQPFKISDYHKPAQTFNGYGGGYGGL